MKNKHVYNEFQHQSDIRLLQIGLYVSPPGPSVFFSILVLGDAQRIGVFDPVGLLWLRSAGWHCKLDAAHRDVGQESAGVQS